MGRKVTQLDRKVEALAKRWKVAEAVQRSDGVVPRKKDSKPLCYKMQNTFERNLQGVPGTSMSRSVNASLIRQMEAKGTGTKVASEEQLRRLGAMRSMRNANTTAGNYIQTVLRDQTGDVISYVDGRRR